jgi:hypothetical protein
LVNAYLWPLTYENIFTSSRFTSLTLNNSLPIYFTNLKVYVLWFIWNTAILLGRKEFQTLMLLLTLMFGHDKSKGVCVPFCYSFRFWIERYFSLRNSTFDKIFLSFSGFCLKIICCFVRQSQIICDFKNTSFKVTFNKFHKNRNSNISLINWVLYRHQMFLFFLFFFCVCPDKQKWVL